MALTSAADHPLAARMRGRVVTSADRDWDAVRQVFDLTTDVRPAAIALPRDVADVAAAVGFARASGLRVAAQAGGHNAAAHGALGGVLLVDVRELQEIAIDPFARHVRVGAGVRWQQLVPSLSEFGLAALHGSSPDVGIAGYSLGGGMGWLARKHGLQANSLTAVELVTADGRPTRVDAAHQPELFWALRGGGGNFGVVTAIEFGVQAVEDLYAGALFFRFDQAGEVLRRWSRLLPGLPDELMTWTKLLQLPDLPDVPEPLRGGSFTVVFGAYLGEEAAGRDLLRPLRDLGPALDTFAVVPPVGLAELAMDPPHPLPYVATTAVLGDLSDAAVDGLLAAAGPGSGSPLAMVELRHLGGALGRPSPGAGARATVEGEVVLVALGVAEDEAAAATAGTYLQAIDRAVEPHRVGHYANFVERPVDARELFDEETWRRLREIKALVDPTDLFKGNHHIPPASRG